MKIAVASDVHDNLSNLKKVLGYLNNNKIKDLIFCGDLTTQDSLKKLQEDFEGKIYIVRGNADSYKFNKSQLTIFNKLSKSNFQFFDQKGEIEIDKVKIGFTHYPDVAKHMPVEEDFEFVFYGHTHKPWIEQDEKTVLANPGNVTGQPYMATFAVLDTENRKLELVKVNEI